VSPLAVDSDERLRRRAGTLSLLVALALLAVKYEAWRRTGSAAILSDALESIVNVVAALFGLGSLVFAGRPADKSHPYGHGKIEFFSAAFEGGLIVLAAVWIVYEALRALVAGAVVRELDAGLVLVFAAGLANLALGLFLVRTGRRHASFTLVADGQHVLSDSMTSAGILVGLVVVRLTGLAWLDPLIACAVACTLLVTGFRLVRRAAGGLLDEEDTELLTRLLAALDRRTGAGMISIHHLRAIRTGRFHHVDAHLVVPEFWSVERAHVLAEGLAAEVIRELGVEGEVAFHTDPCHRAYCARCDLADCAVRRAPFAGRVPLRLEEALEPDRPVERGT
jgi:cation diffusion facilitator family transporter